MVRCARHDEGRPIMATRANERLHLVRVVAPTELPVCIVRRYDRQTDSFVGPPDDVGATLPRGSTKPDKE